MLNTAFTALALLFIVAMLLQIFTIQAFFTALEKRHKELYEEMGKPKWRIQLADDAFKRGLVYIRSKQFQELDDLELEKVYKKLKRTDYAAMGFGVIALGIVVFQAVILS
jgi:hypothetical protein